MWKIQKTICLFVFILILGIGFSCDALNPTDDDNEPGTLIVKITEVHFDVKSIFCRLSSENFDSRYLQTTVIKGMQPYLIFENVEAGTWQLTVDATNMDNIIVYSSTTEVEILKDQVSVENFNLKNAFLIHTQSYRFNYDFSDGDLSLWSGPAFADASEGMLDLWSQIGYKWRSISGESNLFFQAGTIEFDIRPMDGEYTFETKGTPKRGGTLQWGVYMRWKNNSIHVHDYNNGELTRLDTGISYQNQNWYHVTINFNCVVGERGKFSFWIQDITTGSDEVYAGEFDHYTETGLMGVNRISLGVYDPIVPRTVIQHVYFDNFDFRLY